MAPSTVRRGEKKNDALTVNCYERSKTSSAVSARVCMLPHARVCECFIQKALLSWLISNCPHGSRAVCLWRTGHVSPFLEPIKEARRGITHASVQPFLVGFKRQTPERGAINLRFQRVKSPNSIPTLGCCCSPLFWRAN